MYYLRVIKVKVLCECKHYAGVGSGVELPLVEVEVWFTFNGHF